MNGNSKNYNSNERDFPWPVGHEPTEEEVEKYFKEATGIDLSFHWEYIGGKKKKGVLTPIKKNMEILTGLEKALGNGQPVNFQIENPDRELKKASKEEFANWMIEGKEEKNVKTPPKESLIYSASGDINGIALTERKGKNGFFRESYYQPRSEEEKKQIIERDKKRREEENFLAIEQGKTNEESKTNSEKEISAQQNQNKSSKITSCTSSQPKSSNSDNNFPTNWIIGGGIIAVIGLTTLIIVKSNKKKKRL